MFVLLIVILNCFLYYLRKFFNFIASCFSSKWPGISRGFEENQRDAGDDYEKDGCVVKVGERH